ncbi:MAG: 1-hydroxycarotenoid 3,4-desaturase CrtD [Pseudomonadota bacterium]
MREVDVIIIGAGMGGLASAISLASRGYGVLVVERAAAPGGKMREIMIDGRAIDSGPTVFTMRWVFDALLERAGTTLEQEVNIKQARVLARHVWDGAPDEILDLHADINEAADTIGRFAGPREADGYRAFCRETRDIFNTLKDPFMAAQRPSLFNLPLRTGLSGVVNLARTKPLEKMWSALGKHFQDPRLRQLFGRYATYCGSSPFEAAATLMLVAHVEQDGVWLVKGGMHNLAKALERVAQRLDAKFMYDSCVSKILVEGGAVAGVRLADGQTIKSKIVISNADVAAVASGLFGPDVQKTVPVIPTEARSLSAMTWSMNTNTHGFPLARHSVFFSQNYQAEFDDLFKQRKVPNNPTVYICAQDRNDAGLRAQNGKERLLVLINAPATGDKRDFSAQEIGLLEDRTFNLLSRCGLSVERTPSHSQVTTPADFNHLFPASGGALYGRASHGFMSSFQRPGASTAIPGLYLASGSAHPGPGIPMASLSGILAAEQIAANHKMAHIAPRVVASEHMEAAQ